MKHLLLTSICLLFIFTSYCQIEKHNWLVGGVGYYKSTKTNLATYNNVERDIFAAISPDIGYFIIDKLALGANLGFGYQSSKITNATSTYTPSVTTLSGGPFVRYYFLKKDKLVNIIFHGSFNHFINYDNNNNSKSTDTGNRTTIEGGPVLFFNSSVALELLAGWVHRNNGYPNEINVGLGFQIHLMK